MLVLNPQFSGNRIMKRSKFFYLKNGMLGANFIANFIGVTKGLIEREKMQN